MTDGPLVSVITLTYNHANYIEQCLDSVIEQDYDKWELLVTDDGSVDSTPAIVREYSNERIHLLRRDHQGYSGIGDAYNQALKRARGDLIAILDGDDFWPSDKLGLQVPLFRSSSVVLSWGKGIKVDREGLIRGPLWDFGEGRALRSLDRSELLSGMLWTNLIVPASGVMIRRRALLRVGGFWQPEGVPYADRPTWTRLIADMEASERFVYVGSPVAYWRSHPTQLTRNYSVMLRAKATIAREVLHLFANHDLHEFHMTRDRLGAAVSYHQARYHLATGEWARARRELRGCWRDATPRRKRVILASICSLIGVDLFPLLPYDL